MSVNQPYSTPPARPNSTMAVVSLIAGILGLLQIVPIIGPIVAVITGHIAKNEIRNSMGALGGDGMATAGLILGYATIALGLCFICLFLILPAMGLLSIPFLEGMNF